MTTKEDDRKKNGNTGTYDDDWSKEEKKCTCELAIIDLSNPNAAAKESIVQACCTHGAFFVQFKDPKQHQQQQQQQLPNDSCQVASLFHPSKITTTSKCIYRGRTCESGSTIQASEPKESWEYSFFHNQENNNDDDDDDDEVSQVLSKWAHSLRQVTMDIAKVLEWDSQLVLYDNPTTTTTTSDDDCMDLLRVFYYHPKESLDDTDWGSSPHTDWGTWTVVWQGNNNNDDDETDGLHIYCQTCQASKLVVSANNNCVLVHVGDMTSLASNRYWISPYHCVSRLLHQYRTSLVYFAYPPKHMSFSTFQQHCSFPPHNTTTTTDNNNNTHTNNTNTNTQQQLPYSHYSLLHNQQQQQQQQDETVNDPSQTTTIEQQCQQTFQCIQTKSIQQVIQAKWNQVQRSSS